jgi:hypothetical protein
MRLPYLLAASICLLGGSAGRQAGAQEAPDLSAREPISEAARFRLDLRAGVGIRNDTLTTGSARIGARGTALSDFVLGGAWFHGRSPIGVAGRMELDRFALRTDSGGSSVSATGLELHAGAAGRVHPGDSQVLLEGQLGYGFLQVPLGPTPASNGMLPASADTLRAHGPVIAALIAVAPTDAFTLEVAGRAVPVSFGGRYHDEDVSVRRLAAGLGASIGRVTVADFKIAALVSYELANTVADETGVSIRQLRHQIAFGLRALPNNPRPVAAPRDEEIAAPARGRIRGLVRLQAGAALANVAVAAVDGPSTKTGADGSFTLTEVSPGLVRVNLSRADLVSSQEVVSVPPGGEVTVQITLRLAQAPAPAVLIGIVRGEDGHPVEAKVRLLEPSLDVDADARGRFRFEVPAGRYTLTIEAPGFITQKKSVRAGAGEQNIYNVDLQAEK